MGKVSEIMGELQALSREPESFEVGLAMYLRMLDLLNHMEVIHPQSRLDYPAIGADLFPFFFATAGWTWDIRLTLEMVRSAFSRLTHRPLPRHDFTRTHAVPIKHFCDSFLSEYMLRHWSMTLQEGDVLFLKHAREYFVAQHPRNVTFWMDNIGDAVPLGVRVVLFEPQLAEEHKNEMTLSAFFVETGRFVDVTRDLFGARAYGAIQEVNRRILEFNRQVIRLQVKCHGCVLSHCVGCNERRLAPEVYFDAVGALSVLERR